MKRILDVCNETYEEKRDSLVIRLLYETGFKIGDILELDKENLKMYEYKVINICSAKKIMSEKLSESLARDLKEFIEKDLEDVYPNRKKLFEELSREKERFKNILRMNRNLKIIDKFKVKINLSKTKKTNANGNS